MLRKLRNTLIVAIGLLLLFGMKEVSYAKEVADSSPMSDIDIVYNERLDSLISNTDMQVFEKYANLLVICYCQVSSLYIDGEIPADWYLLERKPFIDEMRNLLTATNEQMLEGYKYLLTYLFDTMTEDAIAGYEVDINLYNFVLNEINIYGVPL